MHPMRILALQLKRIGDLVLTTPALRALRSAWPEAHLALGVSEGCASLLGAIAPIDSAIVFGRGRGWAPWQQVLTGPWDICLDFTGTDRSALATLLSRAADRRTFTWIRRNRLRSLAYGGFVDSPVRDRHTADHYLDLAGAAISHGRRPAPARDGAPDLRLSAAVRTAAEEMLSANGVTGAFAIIHPGTARPEKFWLADRWAPVAGALATRHGVQTVISTGPDPFERAHAAEIQGMTPGRRPPILLPPDLLTLAALVERAAVVVSGDTGIVHLAAAFQRPQVTLYGPTNPFHWRPRHARAAVISAAQPDAPLTDFQPRMKGAPMERISTAVVIHATEGVLTENSPTSSRTRSDDDAPGFDRE